VSRALDFQYADWQHKILAFVSALLAFVHSLSVAGGTVYLDCRARTETWRPCGLLARGGLRLRRSHFRFGRPPFIEENTMIQSSNERIPGNGAIALSFHIQHLRRAVAEFGSFAEWQPPKLHQS